MTIYVITNNRNGKSYVGQSVNVLKRVYEHFRTASEYSPTLIGRAIHKHGADAFSVRWMTLGSGSDREGLNRSEQFWIDHLGTLAPSGYNLTTGGRAYSPSPETRERMSRARLSWILSTETKAKLSAAFKGRGLSDETRAKMSLSRKGKKQSAAHIAARSRPCSPETKAKIAAKKRERDAALTPEQRLALANHCRGKKHSEEMRAKLRAGSARRWARYRADKAVVA